MAGIEDYCNQHKEDFNRVLKSFEQFDLAFEAFKVPKPKAIEPLQHYIKSIFELTNTFTLYKINCLEVLNTIKKNISDKNIDRFLKLSQETSQLILDKLEQSRECHIVFFPEEVNSIVGSVSTLDTLIENLNSLHKEIQKIKNRTPKASNLPTLRSSRQHHRTPSCNSPSQTFDVYPSDWSTSMINLTHSFEKIKIQKANTYPQEIKSELGNIIETTSNLIQSLKSFEDTKVLKIKVEGLNTTFFNFMSRSYSYFEKSFTTPLCKEAYHDINLFLKLAKEVIEVARRKEFIGIEHERRQFLFQCVRLFENYHDFLATYSTHSEKYNENLRYDPKTHAIAPYATHKLKN